MSCWDEPGLGLEPEPQPQSTFIEQVEPPSQSRVALVSGGGRGLGLAIARGLARDGWDLALLGQQMDRVRSAALALSQEFGIRAVAASADVADHHAVLAAARTLSKALGTPRLLVNNAGVIEHDEVPIWESDPLEWRRVIEVDLIGVFNLSWAVVPLMLTAQHRPVRVVNLSSGAAARDGEYYSAYHAAKTGLARVTGALHLGGLSRGLLAFDISPGVVRTDMTAGMRVHDDRTDWNTPEAVAELVCEVAHGRWDAFSGRHLRAGLDELSASPVASHLDEHARRLRLQPWGPQDPLLG